MSFTENIDDVVAENPNGLLGKHSSWERVKLKDVAKILNGFPFDSTRFRKDEGVPLIRIRDILRGKTETYLEGAYDEAFLVQPGELLVGMDGDFHSAIWRGTPALLNQRVCKLSPLEEFYSKRLIAFVLPGYLSAINSQTPSVTVKHLSSRTIADIPLPLPPRTEQQLIVAELEKQFTRLEAGMAALQRVQANLKRYRTSVIKAACEGRLVPTEAELQKSEGRSQKSKARYESGEALLARILNERRRIHDRAQADATRKKKYKEPTPSVIPVDEELPEGWTWATWDQIGFSQNGRPFPSAKYQETGFKLLRPGNLHVSGKVVWTESSTRYMPQKFADDNPDLIVRGGELVMNLTAQSLKDEFLGRVCLTSTDEACLLNQRLARLTPILVLPKFVLCLLKAWRFRRYVDGLNSGSLIQHMFTSQLAEFTFPLPPLAEQTRIVAEVERRLSVVEELASVVVANLQRVTRLSKAILKYAVEGKLVDQQPDDESAESLLKRIMDHWRLEKEKPKHWLQTLVDKAMPEHRKQALKEMKLENLYIGRRRPLIEVLNNAKKPLSPEDLFADAGFREEEVEAFFEELKQEEAAGRIEEQRTGKADVRLIAVTKPIKTK